MATAIFTSGDGYSLRINVESRDSKVVGRDQVGKGNKEFPATTTAGMTVIAKGERTCDPKRITNVVGDTITKYLGSPAAAMPPSIASGLIVFEWSGLSNVSEGDLLALIGDNVMKSEIGKQTTGPKVRPLEIDTKIVRHYWVCQDCRYPDGEFQRAGAARTHGEAFPSHTVRAMTRDAVRIKGIRDDVQYWRCDTCTSQLQFPQRISFQSKMEAIDHMKTHPNHEVFAIVEKGEEYDPSTPPPKTSKLKPLQDAQNHPAQREPEGRSVQEDPNYKPEPPELKGLASMPPKGIKGSLFSRCPAGGRHEWTGWTIYLAKSWKSNVKEMTRRCRKCGKVEKKLS